MRCCSSASRSTMRTYPAIALGRSLSRRPRWTKARHVVKYRRASKPMAARAKKNLQGRRARTTRGGLAAIVLAAGKGTRMRSSRAKVLHEILGRPLGAYPIDLARMVGADPVIAVLGHQRAVVEAALADRFGADAVTVVEQAEQRGTGHAVRLAMASLKRFTGELVLVLYGDVPLLRRETLAALV